MEASKAPEHTLLAWAYEVEDHHSLQTTDIGDAELLTATATLESAAWSPSGALVEH